MSNIMDNILYRKTGLLSCCHSREMCCRKEKIAVRMAQDLGFKDLAVSQVLIGQI